MIYLFSFRSSTPQSIPLFAAHKRFIEQAGHKSIYLTWAWKIGTFSASWWIRLAWRLGVLFAHLHIEKLLESSSEYSIGLLIIHCQNRGGSFLGIASMLQQLGWTEVGMELGMERKRKPPKQRAKGVRVLSSDEMRIERWICSRVVTKKSR